MVVAESNCSSFSGSLIIHTIEYVALSYQYNNIGIMRCKLNVMQINIYVMPLFIKNVVQISVVELDSGYKYFYQIDYQAHQQHSEFDRFLRQDHLSI